MNKNEALQQLVNLGDGAQKDCRENNIIEMVNVGFDRKDKTKNYVADFIDGLEYNGYENLAWYAGYIRGLEEARGIVREIK